MNTKVKLAIATLILGPFGLSAVVCYYIFGWEVVFKAACVGCTWMLIGAAGLVVVLASCDKLRQYDAAAAEMSRNRLRGHG